MKNPLRLQGVFLLELFEKSLVIGHWSLVTGHCAWKLQG